MSRQFTDAEWALWDRIRGCFQPEPPTPLFHMRYIRRLPQGVTSDFHVDISAAQVDQNSDRMIATSGHAPMMNVGYWGHEYSVDPEHSPRPWSLVGWPIIETSFDAVPLVKVYDVSYLDAQGVPSLDDGYDVGDPTPKARWPIPEFVKLTPSVVQGGRVVATSNPGEAYDQHLVMFDPTRLWLWEIYQIKWDEATQRWSCAAAQFTDLSKPPTASWGRGMAGASGIPFAPGLFSYEEIYGPGELAHGGLANLAKIAPRFVSPARHSDGTGSTDCPPMGARLRLKASVDENRFPDPGFRKWMRALKKYGLIINDSSGVQEDVRMREGDLLTSGIYDERWDAIASAWIQMGHQLFTTDFEIVVG